MEFDPRYLPPICLNWATDVLETGRVDDSIELAVALDGLRAAAAPQQLDVEMQAECRVTQCPVKCRLINKVTLDGSVQLAGVSSDEGVTDLTNCNKR
jgi:hypothetical protein